MGETCKDCDRRNVCGRKVWRQQRLGELSDHDSICDPRFRRGKEGGSTLDVVPSGAPGANVDHYSSPGSPRKVLLPPPETVKRDPGANYSGLHHTATGPWSVTCPSP